MKKNFITCSLFTLICMFIPSCQRSAEEEPSAERLMRIKPNVLLPSTMDPTKEKRIWTNFNATLGNPFVPIILQDSLSNEIKRERQIRFEEYLLLRRKINNGMASSSERKTFFEYKSRNLKFQKEVTDHYLKRAGEENIQELRRIKKVKAETDHLTTLLNMYRKYRGKAIYRNPSTRKNRDKVLCVSDDNGLVYCLKEKDLSKYLISGHWKGNGEWENDRFNEALGYYIFEKIDQVNQELGRDLDDDILVGCGNGFFFTFSSENDINTIFNGSRELKNIPFSDLKIISDICRISVEMDNENTPDLSQPSSWADETIKKIDEMIDNCQYSGDPRIAESPWADYAEDLFLDLAKDVTEKVTRDVSKVIEYTIKVFGGAMAAIEKGKKDFAQGVNDALEGKPPSQDIWDWTGKTPYGQGYERALEVECSNGSSKACGILDDIDPTPDENPDDPENPNPTPPDSPGPTFPDDDNPQPAGSQTEGANYSTCEGRKKQWELFKQECNGLWDKPGTKCNELLRRMNGCVSSTLITPHPEGDKTCIRLNKNERDAIIQGCEERKKYAMLMEHFDFTCGFLENPKPGIRVDVCNNPNARPTPDQDCSQVEIRFGRPVEPIQGGSPPKPYANIMQVDKLIIIDGLGLDGIGVMEFQGNPESQ